MIRIATVGSSKITDSFLAAATLTGRFHLTAVYSRNADTGNAFAKKHGCKKVFTDLEALAQSDEIDAVYIASPNICHFAQSKLFLSNGKHVLCEKPAVTKSCELQELYHISRENKVVFMEALMAVYTPAQAILKNALSSIGKVSMARIDFCQRSSRYDAFKRGEPVNIFDMSLAAGTLMDLGIYCVYAAVDLFGMPDSVTAKANFLHNGADGSGCALFHYKDYTVVLTYGKTGQSSLGSEIIGDNGTIKIGSVSQYQDISLVQNGTEKVLVAMAPRPEVMRGEADAFADFICNPKECSENYDTMTELTLRVHECMDIIRNECNIKF